MQRTMSVRGKRATAESRIVLSRCVELESSVIVDGSKIGSLCACKDYPLALTRVHIQAIDLASIKKESEKQTLIFDSRLT